MGPSYKSYAFNLDCLTMMYGEQFTKAILTKENYVNRFVRSSVVGLLGNHMLYSSRNHLYIDFISSIFKVLLRSSHVYTIGWQHLIQEINIRNIFNCRNEDDFCEKNTLQILFKFLDAFIYFLDIQNICVLQDLEMILVFFK